MQTADDISQNSNGSGGGGHRDERNAHLVMKHALLKYAPVTAVIFGQRFYLDQAKFEADFRKYSAELVYNDDVFPPVDSSIINPNDIVDDLEDLGPVNWNRICDIPALLDSEGK